MTSECEKWCAYSLQTFLFVFYSLLLFRHLIHSGAKASTTISFIPLPSFSSSLLCRLVLRKGCCESRVCPFLTLRFISLDTSLRILAFIICSHKAEATSGFLRLQCDLLSYPRERLSEVAGA
ncbi:hypothetical protein BJ165DRAFT_1501612 [Panaeolus papilionaceus]|nr:hypothetical protein BJ165DRAFT_1501612 [Panaeolus papilionaceus]